MTDNGAPRKKLPPYVPYRTFINFIDGLRIALPQIIDRSLMKSMSGTTQGQVISALEYLGLITDTGEVTEKMGRLVNSEGAEREQTQKEIIKSGYAFLFEDDGFQIKRATQQQLDGLFSQEGVSGDTLRKAVTFFIKASKDAKITLSPHVTKARISKSSPAKPGKKTTQKKNKASSNSDAPKEEDVRQEDISLEKILLSKFPAFNPSWEPEVQVKWFDGFDKLMERVKSKGENGIA